MRKELIKGCIMQSKIVTDNKPQQENILTLTKDQLIEKIVALGEKPYRAKQVWHWLYNHGVKQFSDMKNVNKIKLLIERCSDIPLAFIAANS